jgi:hypothetical protein
MAFPLTPILDDFNRSENPLSTGWDTALLGSFQANGSTCQSNASGYAFANRSTLYTGNQECFVTCSTKGNTDDEFALNLMTQNTGSILTVDAYNVVIEVESGTDSWRIQRIDNIVATVLANGTFEFSSGAQFGLRWQVGGIITLFHNGNVLGSATDGTYSGTGKIGLTIENTAIRCDNFGGGEMRTIMQKYMHRTMQGLS